MNAVELLSVVVVCVSMTALGVWAFQHYSTEDRSIRRRREQQQRAAAAVRVATRAKPNHGLPKHIRETFPTFIYSADAAEGPPAGVTLSSARGSNRELAGQGGGTASGTEGSVGSLGGSLRRGYAAVLSSVVGGVGGSMRLGGSVRGGMTGPRAGGSTRGGGSVGGPRSPSSITQSPRQTGESTWHGHCQAGAGSLHGGCGNSSCRVSAVAAALLVGGVPAAEGGEASSLGRSSSQNVTSAEPELFARCSSAPSAPPAEAAGKSGRHADVAAGHGAHAAGQGAPCGECGDVEECGEHACNAACACSWRAMCVICLAEFSEGETLLRLPCSHAFHVECVNLWFECHSTCPICRLSLVPKEADPAPAAAEPDADPAPSAGEGGAATDPAEHGNGNGTGDLAMADTAAAGANSADSGNGSSGQAGSPAAPSEGASMALALGSEDQKLSMGGTAGSAGQLEVSGGADTAEVGGEGMAKGASGADSAGAASGSAIGAELAGAKPARASWGVHSPSDWRRRVGSVQNDAGRNVEGAYALAIHDERLSHTCVPIDADDGAGQQEGGGRGPDFSCEERVHGGREAFKAV